MSLNYSYISADIDRNWIVEETEFDPLLQGKCEAIMCIGNGYLGSRCATEESYVGQVRNTFLSGTFDRFHESEVTELPNVPDIFAMDIRIDGKRFSLIDGAVENYSRRIDLRSGEVVRELRWIAPNGKRVEMSFRRFASMHDLHLVVSRLTIKAIDSDVQVSISTGIDGRQTNSGTQHFIEGEKRVYDKRILELLARTAESQIDVLIQASHQARVDGEVIQLPQRMRLGRRQVLLDYEVSLSAGQELALEKQARFYSSIDREFGDDRGFVEIRDFAVGQSRRSADNSYQDLLRSSEAQWEAIWNDIDVIVSGNDFDQLAIRFALYHMCVFTPAHDARSGIGAKGLSGEGYKGHSFWDSEIFILPFFIFSQPKIARQLLEYRYLTLPGARKNAANRGYKGAMYAWESARTGEDVTPEWGAVDIHTGEATRIWSGVIEQHITADIAYAVWTYYRVTKDQKFMDEMGYEILFDTATFWCSRLEWLDGRGQWGFNDVIGPDEYKEHVDNNAFTNYLAEHNIRLAIEYFEQLEAYRPEVLAGICADIDRRGDFSLWTQRVVDIYLPQPRQSDYVIPQDDSYFQKEIIDLSKYKSQTCVGSLFHDYSLEQVNEIQVSKQADIVALFWLMRHRFTDEELRANWSYYEPKTLHDSSLSLSTHACVAAEVGDGRLAYELFQKAARIDLGPNMKTSDHGIHAAAMGGIWQAVVAGFGGLKVVGDKLQLQPRLPLGWDRLVFSFFWQGQRIEVKVGRGFVELRKDGSGGEVALSVLQREITLRDEVRIDA